MQCFSLHTVETCCELQGEFLAPFGQISKISHSPNQMQAHKLAVVTDYSAEKTNMIKILLMPSIKKIKLLLPIISSTHIIAPSMKIVSKKKSQAWNNSYPIWRAHCKGTKTNCRGESSTTEIWQSTGQNTHSTEIQVACPYHFWRWSRWFGFIYLPPWGAWRIVFSSILGLGMPSVAKLQLCDMGQEYKTFPRFMWN